MEKNKMMEGTLKIIKKSKQLFIEYINQSGVLEKTKMIPNSQLSIALIELKKGKGRIKMLKDLKVEFESIDANGIPQKVREKGTVWNQEEEDNYKKSKNKPSTDQNESENNNNSDYQSDFYNPYNFIPTPPRNDDQDSPIGHGKHHELDDNKPIGHGKYHSNYWSGQIAVTLTTKTPLLIPDASKAEDKDGHKTYDVRKDSQNKPILPITSVKGMLRNEYEAITNSRYGILQKHEDRLAYRMPPNPDQDDDNKQDLKPAKVENKNGQLFLRIMNKSYKLRCYKNHNDLNSKDKSRKDKGQQQEAIRYENRKELPQHGDAVWVKWDDNNQRKIYYRNRNDNNNFSDNRKKGWICATGANIDNKINERIFIENNNDKLIEITPEIKSLWEELVRNYQQTHVKDLEKREKKDDKPTYYLGNKPSDTAWSKHIWDKNELDFKEGTLCYVELEKNKIKAIQPVTISRRLYNKSPHELLPDSLKPASQMSELSPADRVFGWVNQNGKGSYKGNLRLNSMKCISSKEDAIAFFEKNNPQKPTLPLNILGQPQPSQAKFYQAKDKDGEPLEKDTQKQKSYSTREQGLRGRKVYPYQNLPPTHWHDPTNKNLAQTKKEDEIHYREYYRLGETPEKQKDDQNRSFKAWVKPNTIFTFNIEITNLSPVELGALLYLLSLEKDHYHRLGGGKPYGFGSVTLDIEWDNSDLRTGEGWKEYYSSLFNKTSHNNDEAKKTIEKSYQKAVKEAYGNKDKSFEDVSFIKAFEVYTRGYSKNLPIHYPRLEANPNQDTKIFDWFVENDANRKDGNGFKLALPTLSDEKGLPYQPHEPKTDNSNQSQRR